VQLALCGALLTGCAQGRDASLRNVATQTPQNLMVRVAKQMQICWFKNKDPAIAPYKLASEVNSYAGKPRLLLVPRNRPSGLPVLVVQAERKGGRNHVQTFGPLLASKDGPRLAAAVSKWTSGGTAC